MTGIEKKKKFIINVLYTAVVIALFYLFFKYVLGAVLPIIVAIILAMILQRPVNFICRKTPLKRGLVSALTVLFTTTVIFGILSLVLIWLFSELKGLVQYLIIRFEDLPALLSTIEGYLVNLVSFLPEQASSVATTFIHEKFVALADGSMASEMSFDLSMLSTPLLGVWNTVKQIPTTLVSIVISIVACCFMTADYKTLKRVLLGVFKVETQENIIHAKRLIFPSLAKYAKAYGLIMLITFTEVSVGLFLLKLLNVYNGGYIFIIAIITAIVDIVPVLGTGTIVIPWAVYNLFVGNYGLAIGLFAMYILITIIRQIIEPKMVATQLGIPAFLIITSMFIGSQIFGVLGIFILPITILMLKLLNDEGIIHIFHSPEKEADSVEKEENL